MSASPELASLARDFAADLTRTVRAVVGPECPAFIADTPQTPLPSGSSAVVVRQSPAEGIVLRSGVDPLLTLTVEFRCAWDGHGSYLAVIWSRIAVFPREDVGREPLVRYEYDKAMRSGLPAAHLQVHGSHHALTEVMADAGVGTPRGRRRRASSASGRVPALSQLHFPVGGHRFRPCLEDLLAVLIDEFGIDVPGGDRQAALDALADGREDWRRSQVGAAVRDAPDEAVRVLRELGYVVHWDSSQPEPVGQPERLRAL